MCGLTGVLSNWLSEQEIGTFRDLMVLSSFRGMVGAGITAVPQAKKKAIEICRSTGPSFQLAYSERFAKTLKELGTTTLLMGHARLPTRGGIEIADTHPHVCGNTVGMHNGTMSVVNGAVVQKDENDSRLLFECLEKEGLETTLKRAVGEFAISWIDMTKGTLNFYRNTKRPLWFATLKGSTNTIWYASEPEFLFLVLDRTFGEDQAEVAELAPFHLLSFPIRPRNNDKINPVRFENILPTATSAAATSVPVVTPNSGNALPEEKQTSRVSYITHAGKTVSHEELMVALAHGCVSCGQSKGYEDYRKCGVVWCDRTEFVCKECYQLDPFARQLANAYNPSTKTLN